MLFIPILYSTLFVGTLALFYLFYATRWLQQQKNGTPKMNAIASRIAQGAIAFLKTEYLYIGYVIVFSSGLMALLGLSSCALENNLLRILNYLVGAGLSAVAGVLGMRIATITNVKTAQAARKSLPKAFQISFVGGAIMGIGIVAFALIGLVMLLLAVSYKIFGTVYLANIGIDAAQLRQLLEVLTGFALGAELIAIFARVAGGIYTKAADVGADIVGKIEAGIPEDDPRNPATIADNVGDNVGDVAGMGADLFGSYVSTLLAAMVLGISIVGKESQVILAPLMLPIALSALGLLASLFAVKQVRLLHEKSNIQAALNQGNFIALTITALCAFPLIRYIVPETLQVSLKGQAAVNALTFGANQLYGAVLIGLFVGLIVSWITEYFTSMKNTPVRFIVGQSFSGPATNVLAGLSMGMFSVAIPMLIFAIAIYATYYLAGFYGVAISAVSMMSTTGIQLAMDAFGPIADNAGGIAEMSRLPAAVRRRTDALDTVGNTTAASGKGFAIASAALTALGLLVAFVQEANLTHINFCEAPILAGAFIGAVIPFLFSGLTIRAVSKAAMEMVYEVRRQFREIPGILEGKNLPQYDRCIAIATKAALREMLLPALLTVVTPIFLYIACGPQVLAAFFMSLVVVGTAMALFQCNAGGAWDNAKKAFEKGGNINGQRIKKGTPAHAAAVVGDTVGDPLKDTSGPGMNILIKLSILCGIVIQQLLT